MNSSDQTKTSMKLAADLYTTYVDAATASNQRMLGFAKSAFEILTRPYSSTAVESAWRENLDRTNQIVELSVSELQTASTHASQVVESLVAHGTTLQETAMETARGLMQTSVSNMTFVKETSEKTLDTFAGRMRDFATPSAN